ncbi:hypothetical protein [Flavobacterium sp. KBS0721]|uniref:hypothetical protein n=1 Tax=Flavobacterium sp. KBS0721 TaxID=1179672 RepID=UPI00098F70B5|nr:hypothetical protein [Flavobacterium sp. KBS0721]QDW23015.1 hypothetical protein B0M43_0023790 [Flavobacterium sp. KBS0721]
MLNLHDFKTESLKLIYEDAKNRFDDITKASDTIDTKANTLFNLLILIVITTLGFLVNKYPCINYKDLIVQDAIALCIVSVVSLIWVSTILFPSKIRLKGTKPNFHIESPNFNRNWTDDQTSLYVLYDCVNTIQISIKENEEIHSKRVKNFKWACFIIAYSMPIILIWSIVAIARS